jgi:hypothetical protein
VNLKYLGDGRNDSPGHSAQYCSYTFMEYDTKKIISLLTIDKRQTERKSVNMGKRGFIQALNEIKDNGLSVKEVVTDAHLGISSVMSMFIHVVICMNSEDIINIFEIFV